MKRGWGYNRFNLGTAKSAALLITAVALLLIATLAGKASAFGVSTPYYPNDTIRIEPGQDFKYTITLQNADDLDFNVSLNYESDRDIAKLEKSDFYIPARSYDNKYTFDIHIPRDATPGDTYILSFTAKPIMPAEGQVPIGVEIKRNAYFKIVRDGGQGTSNTPLTYVRKALNDIAANFKGTVGMVLLAILLLLGLAFVVIRMWNVSKGIAMKSAGTTEKAPFTLSEAKSLSDILTLVRMMSGGQFNHPHVRNLLSQKLADMGESFLSRKVLTVKRRSEFMRMLK
jgi:hypothetical protein